MFIQLDLYKLYRNWNTDFWRRLFSFNEELKNAAPSKLDSRIL